jgi:Sulfotransferase family
MSTVTMPNFIIIGAAKAGTSSIFQYMGQHPEIFTSTPKEPSFFLFDFVVPEFKGPGDDTFYRTVIADPEAYAALFDKAHSAKAVGEASTNYLHDESAAQRIYKRLPEVKLIVVLRNPVERAYSHYWMYRLAGRETESFGRALDQEEVRRSSNWGSGWQYARTGCYAEHIGRYLSFFPRERLLITLYEDFERDSTSFMKRIFQFLEVDQSFVPSMGVRYNVSGQPTSALTRFLLSSRHPIRQTLKDMVPKSVRFHLATRLRQKYLSKPEMPEDCKVRLQEMYRPDLAKLEKMLDRSLSHWIN